MSVCSVFVLSALRSYSSIYVSIWKKKKKLSKNTMLNNFGSCFHENIMWWETFLFAVNDDGAVRIMSSDIESESEIHLFWKGLKVCCPFFWLFCCLWKEGGWNHWCLFDVWRERCAGVWERKGPTKIRKNSFLSDCNTCIGFVSLCVPCLPGNEFVKCWHCFLRFQLLLFSFSPYLAIVTVTAHISFSSIIIFDSLTMHRN